MLWQMAENGQVRNPSCVEGIFALFVTIGGMSNLRSAPDRSLTGLVRSVHWISSSSNPDLRDSRDLPGRSRSRRLHR
jgi:hypothetical protein